MVSWLLETFSLFDSHFSLSAVFPSILSFRWVLYLSEQQLNFRLTDSKRDVLTLARGKTDYGMMNRINNKISL